MLSSKNGTPMCAGCKGFLYVTTPEDGFDQVKGYVQNADTTVTYSFAGGISNRYDY